MVLANYLRAGLASDIGKKIISPFANIAPACAPAYHVYLVWWRALSIPVCRYHNWAADQHFLPVPKCLDIHISSIPSREPIWSRLHARFQPIFGRHPLSWRLCRPRLLKFCVVQLFSGDSFGGFKAFELFRIVPVCSQLQLNWLTL